MFPIQELTTFCKVREKVWVKNEHCTLSIATKYKPNKYRGLLNQESSGKKHKEVWSSIAIEHAGKKRGKTSHRGVAKAGTHGVTSEKHNKKRQNAVNIYQWRKTREPCQWWLVNMSLEANTKKNMSLISCWQNVNSVVTLVITGEFTSLVENAGNMMIARGKRFRGKN